MERFITDERTGISYELIGDYYIPLLKPPYCPTVGKFGRLRRRYLRENKKVLFYNLLTSGTLGYHLEEIDNSANEMFDLLVKQMIAKQGVTEALKGSDQMKWVGMMNNIRAAADEVVLHQLIYV